MLDNHVKLFIVRLAGTYNELLQFINRSIDKYRLSTTFIPVNNILRSLAIQHCGF